MLPVGKIDRRADARAGQDRAGARRRRYPPHGLAEPADLRRRRRQGGGSRKPPSRRSASSTKATSIRAGLVACTGNVGCRFAASDTKRHAEEIAQWCEARVDLDGPVNIHLTGCHHSCAQHYIGDIGLLACKVEDGEDDDPVEGYHIYGRRRLRAGCRARPRNLSRRQGGGCAAHGRAHAEGLSRASRFGATETFLAFSRRHEIEALKANVRRGGGRHDARTCRRRSPRWCRRPRRSPTSSAPGSTASSPG